MSPNLKAGTGKVGILDRMLEQGGRITTTKVAGKLKHDKMQ